MIKRIILSIGHGGQPGEKFDPGAINALGETENQQAKEICALLAAKLIKAGVSVYVMPDFSYLKSINQVNAIYQPGDWAIEIHKDSFTKFNPETMRRRCGSYFFNKSAKGKTASEIMQRSFIESGAHKTSWSRADNLSRHGGLGWNTMTKPLAHILELGFMQDENDADDDEFYATAAFNAIMKVKNTLLN